MKLHPSILILAMMATRFCVLAVKSSVEADSRTMSDNNNNNNNEITNSNDDRNLRIKRKKISRTFRRKIKPNGDPESVTDAYGKEMRRSVVDLRQLLLDDDEDDVDVQLMSDQPSQTLKMRRTDRIQDPFESWFGMDDSSGNYLTMVKTVTSFGETVTTGTMVGANGTVYQIRTLADGDVVAEEVKQSTFDRELEGPRTDVEGDDDVDPSTIYEIDGPGGGRRGRRELRRLDSSSQIDIMVLYTKGAMCSAAGFPSGGTCDATAANIAKIEGVITLAVAETNKAYEQSGIPTKLRLVKTHFDATFNDRATGWDNTLDYLRNNGDGQLDYVHAMRDQFGADFVSMLVDIGSYCGIGYMPSTPTAGDAFSLVQWSCATGYYSFGHELGHNMCCNHDVKNSGGVAGSKYNFGYQDPSNRFRSILAYDCSGGCPRVQHFSNPNIIYNGLGPIGSAKANNARVISGFLEQFANYRQATVAAPPGPSSPPTPAPTGAPTFAAPTSPPTNSLSLSTKFNGGYVGAAGHMIDIMAYTNMFVTNFAVHASAASLVAIEVYKMRTLGTCKGFQSDPTKWELIGQVTFQSSEALSPSILPLGTFSPVYVQAGTIQSFYITFTEATNLNLYSFGSSVRSIQVSNGDMDILEGYAKQYLFAADYSPRAWNGVVYYEKTSIAPNPTPQPTPNPTTARPTRKPTTRRPTRKPTLKPGTTRPPTRAPTPVPTPAPTPEPTLDPTLEPIAPTSPGSPSLAASGSRDELLSLETTFRGGNGQAGNMIEIRAWKDIAVRSFDIHTYSTGSVHVYIYVKMGTYVGFERDPTAWSLIADTWVQGKGSPNPTPIPAKDIVPVTIYDGETYSFYITLTEPSLRYTRGPVMTEDTSLEFVRSTGNKYPFKAFYNDRIWNGVLKYSLAPGTMRQLSSEDENAN